MFNNFREPQKAVLSIQQDKTSTETDPRQPCLLTWRKPSKRSTRTGPLMSCLREDALCGSYNMPCTCSLEDVSSTKSEGNCYHHEVIRQGVDMGRAFSVFMFAMDPVYWHLNKIPDIVNVKGYVDDCTAVRHCGHDLAWLLPVRRLFTDLHTAGFQIVEHSCWIAVPANTSEHGDPPAGHRKAPSP